MTATQHLLSQFDRLVQSPDAVRRVRRFVLDLAVRGKLVPQDRRDEPASELRKRIDVEKVRSNASGKREDATRLARFERKALGFEPPAQWEWVRLVDLARVSYGFAFPSGQFNAAGRGMPLIRIRDISSTDTEAYFEGSYDPAYVVTVGDYLVGMDGDFNLRRWNGKNGLLNQRVMRINGWRCGVDPEYIRLPLQFILDHLHGETSQTTVKHLSAKQVNSIEIPLPPFAEQRRIAAKVVSLMQLCDEIERASIAREVARNRLTRATFARLTASTSDPLTFAHDARLALNAWPALTTRSSQITEFRQAVIDLAVSSKLAMGITSGAGGSRNWEWRKLGDLLLGDSLNGYSRRPDNALEGTPILRISAGTVRRDGVVAEEEHKLIGNISNEVKRKFELKQTDLLACRFNGNKGFVGRLSIFKDYLGIAPIFPDKLIRLRIDTKLALPEFVRLAGDSTAVREMIEARCATTVGNWGISASSLKEVEFPVPPLSEQALLVSKVAELSEICDRLETSLKETDRIRSNLLNAVIEAAVGSKGDI